MEHRTSIVALVLSVATVAASCGDQDPTVSDSPTVTQASPTVTVSPTPRDTAETTPGVAGERIEISVSGGEVQGPGTVTVEAGTEVILVVTSDVADHIHVHGYDIFQDVAAGETAELTFTADIPGVFEVELEDSETHLVELQVQG